MKGAGGDWFTWKACLCREGLCQVTRVLSNKWVTVGTGYVQKRLGKGVVVNITEAAEDCEVHSS